MKSSFVHKRLKKNVLIAFGTRPEALKFAPLIKILENAPDFNCFVCLTGQHRQMVDQVVEFFKFRVDILAQALRVGSILLQHQRAVDLKNSLEKLKTKLLSFQIAGGSQQGGFWYGQEQNGTIHYHINSWVTMFAVQALSIATDTKDRHHSPYTGQFFI